jgi:UDP-glucose 4-epimerase
MIYKRALITGGAGLVGSHIADLLVCQGLDEIVILDDFTRGRRENLDNALKHGNIRILEGDIRDRAAVREAMDGVDLVFHQAAIRITQCAEDPRLAMDVLANGTFNVLEAAVNARVKKVVAASSASVYGLAEQFPTPESHHGYDNRTIYGAAKLFNEGLLRSFHEMYGLDYVALRYFNVYGPRMDVYGVYTEVLIRWMERLASGKPCLILGDGTQTMDFVFIEDVARANILAANAPVTDRVFNIASGTETSLNELAATLSRVMGFAARSEYGPSRNVNPVSRRLADTREAKRLLDFQTDVSLEEGLSRLVHWWSHQRALQC